MRSPLTEALTRQAYVNALLGGLSETAATMQSQQNVTSRRAQQAGGASSVPNTGDGEGRGGGFGTILGGGLGFLAGGWPGAAIGASLFGGSSGGRQQARQPSFLQQNPDIDRLYRQRLGEALSGNAPGWSSGRYQEALSRGMRAIGAQSQGARQRLQSALGRRGLLSSGALATGLADIEQQRLRSTSDLVGSLQAQQEDLRRRALSQALELAGASERQGAQIAGQRSLVEMQQPDVWDYLAQAAGAAAPYLMGSYEQPDVTGLAAAITRGIQGPAPTTQATGWQAPRTRTPYRLPPELYGYRSPRGPLSI